jgi:uncharacterized protein
VTLLVPQTGDIPVPQPSLVSKPYWDGCLQDQLLVQRCADCGGFTHTPALLCSACLGRSLEWVTSSGQGVVVSWTTVWRPQMEAFIVPYSPAVVELAEGWQMLAAITDCEHDAVRIGMPVEVWFHQIADDVKIPYFRPRTNGSSGARAEADDRGQ